MRLNRSDKTELIIAGMMTIAARLVWWLVLR